MKTNISLTDIIEVAILAGCVAIAGYTTFRDRELEESKIEIQQSGLIWFDESRREYVGIPRNFRGGSEQKIYVDRKPFGSLDGVRLEQYVNGQKNVLKERKPEMNEEDTFFLLENIGKKEHSGLDWK